MSVRKFLDEDGAILLNQLLASKFNSKADASSVPTKTSDLTNDSHFPVDANYTHTDNNYTNSEKTKLGGIATGAEVNAINTIKVNGTAQTISAKAVDISVPTKTSDLTNDNDLVSDSSYVHTDNNYTTTDKNKLSGIASNAQVNKIETIKVNGTAQTITSKAVNITVPTNNNQLTNGAGYQTASDVSSAISSAIAGITGISYEIVQSLPQTGQAGVIYLLSNSGSAPNIYDEYIWVNNAFEKIGTTAVDLTNYMQFSDMVALTSTEINSIFTLTTA